MNINNIRKRIFLNSQYFTHYFFGENTVLRGIIKTNGYIFKGIFSDEKINEINKVYRKMNALLNALVAVEVILYIYFVIFPFFVEIMKYSTAAFIIMLSLIPIVCLYLTYVLVNYLYESYLNKNIGAFRKTKFSPDYNSIKETDFNTYLTTERKSIYLMLLIAVIFFAYVFTPLIITSLVNLEKYNAASKVASAYLKFVPVSADVYADRAYAMFKLKKYEQAAADYKNANKYTLSNAFFNDILGVQLNYLEYNDMIKEFDKAISEQDDKLIKGRLLYEKANYQYKNKDYKGALNSFNSLLSTYKRGSKYHYSPEIAFYNRAIIKMALGDKKGASQDYAYANKLCPICSFEFKTTLVPRP